MSPDEKHQPQQTNGINADDDKHHQINGISDDGSDSVFVKKILEIPTIYDIHHFTKENKYGKIGYQMVGSAGNIVSNVTKPFQNQIRQADVFAANSVGYVEEKFPFFKQPTAEIVDNLKKPITTVGTTIDSRCITPAMNIATNVQSQINQRAVEPTIEIAKKVDASFVGVVDVFESTLNAYLPEDQSTSERSVNTTNTTTINDDSTSADLLQTFRAFNIALTGQRRLTRRVKAQINSTQEYTGEQIKQLQESSQLLKTASETVTSLNQMLLGIVANARGTVKNPEIASTLHSKLHDIASIILGNVNKNEDLPKAVQSRVIELSQTLLQTTDSIATYVKANATYFPDIRFNQLSDFFEKRYVEIVEEIKDGEGTPIEKARKVIMITTQHTLPLLNELQESVQSYSTSLNHSFINTTEKVKSRFIGVN